MGKDKYLKLEFDSKKLKYGKKYGITFKEAAEAFEKGFGEEAKKHPEKYKGYKEIEFILR